MNLKIFFIVFTTLIIGCQGLEFVYKVSPTIKSLENNTQVIVSGDDASIIKSHLNSIIGASKNNGEFLLLVDSKKTSKNIVIKNDQTVSQIEINHSFNYSLQQKDKDCVVSVENIFSRSTYNLKSLGYSYGTDLAKKEALDNNVEKNINDFFELLSHNHSNLEC